MHMFTWAIARIVSCPDRFFLCFGWGNNLQNLGIQNETTIGVTPDPFPHPKHRKKQFGHETIARTLEEEPGRGVYYEPGNLISETFSLNRTLNGGAKNLNRSALRPPRYEPSATHFIPTHETCLLFLLAVATS